nr:ATP-binding cassette domain-containing protein [Gammaproteobacteria bacterium]
EPSSGEVRFAGQNLLQLNRSEMKQIRQRLQIVFQDPFGSLNPRHRVGALLSEPLRVHGIGDIASQKRRVLELLDMVGLPADAVDRYPHEFSGGQRQRIAIARALVLNPELLIADEPVSALDVSIQSQIINLLARLRRQLNLSMLFISHDLSVIRHVSDRIAVMYLGRIVETGETEEILEYPKHPYTKALLSAVPNPVMEKTQRLILQGEMPDPANPPEGCAFHTRCPDITAQVRQRCESRLPALYERGRTANGSRCVACHLYREE